MQRNRGKHPNDDKLFNEKWQAVLKEAATDLSYLLSRGFGDTSSLKLVGNRYKLNNRQQEALIRISVRDNDVLLRQKKAISEEELIGKNVEIDGFNLLILIESALSGAYIFKCRDGNFRDISSVHGSYKRVVKTEEALVLIGNALNELNTEQVTWLFDSPVSNSGRLKTLLLGIADKNHFNWNVELVINPDKDLASSSNTIITSDRWVLDNCMSWFNLSKYLFNNKIPNVSIIEV